MKKKGFTLIELLAVIVILVIVSLITIPTILGIIEKVKVDAVKESANGYIEALNLYIGMQDIKATSNLKPNEQYNVNDTTIIDGVATEPLNDLVQTKGEMPNGDEDYIIFSNNYSVVEGKLTFNGYFVTIEDGEMIVTKIGKVVKAEDMTLNLSEETMERGSMVKIKATFKPSNTTNKKLKYKSSDNNVVNINDKGLITAVGNGTATITVTAIDSNISKEISITVVSPEYATSIKIEKEDKELYVGETIQLTTVLEPDDVKSKSVTWKSLNEDIATVSDSGVVTAKKVGKATITATTMNNKIANIELDIKEIFAESISISGKNRLMTNKTLQLTTTILPANTTNKAVAWSSSDEEVATVSEAGLVTGIKEGTATIKGVTNNGKESSITIQISEKYAVGDLVTIGTENFYVLQDDGTTVTMLSKLRLNVGNYKVADSTVGLQSTVSSPSASSVSAGSPGAIAFCTTTSCGSTNTCWKTNGSNFVNIDLQKCDGPVRTAVNEYKTKLESFGTKIEEARVPYISDLKLAGCNDTNQCTKAPSWTYNPGLYWLGSTMYSTNINIIITNGKWTNYQNGSVSGPGIRPLIKVLKANL